MGTQTGMDASGIAPTCPNPTIPMLLIERLCPLGSSEFSIFFSKLQNLKGIEEQLCVQQLFIKV
jgi:hypothetical protein